MVISKPCIKCGKTLALDMFYPHKQMRDGHLNMCKECSKRLATDYRVSNIERVRLYDAGRANLPHRIALRKIVFEDYTKDFPERRIANNKVNSALRSGKLKRQPCWVCGEKAVAHHPDYSSPLDVVWLCQAHHKQAHALVA